MVKDAMESVYMYRLPELHTSALTLFTVPTFSVECNRSGIQYTLSFLSTVASYPFDEGNPPPFEMIKYVCDDIDIFLKEDIRNVAVINCTDGKVKDPYGGMGFL